MTLCEYRKSSLLICWCFIFCILTWISYVRLEENSFTFQNGRRESMNGQCYCEPITWLTLINLHLPISMPYCTCISLVYRYSKNDTKLNNPDANQQVAKHKASQTSEFTMCFTFSNHAIFLMVAFSLAERYEHTHLVCCT